MHDKFFVKKSGDRRRIKSRKDRKNGTNMWTSVRNLDVTRNQKALLPEEQRWESPSFVRRIFGDYARPRMGMGIGRLGKLGKSDAMEIK